MPNRSVPRVSALIDKLTHSIELAATGEFYATVLTRLSGTQRRQLQKKDWLFNWSRELDTARRQVYKLTTVAEPVLIQGLISLEVDTDHVFVYLVESAAFNKGAQRQYLGVAGNLFAWACRLSFEQGYEGFVAFEAKTALLTHYQQALGAQRMGRGLRMYLATKAATELVSRYFPDYSTP
ncbi:hypothetical protein GO988_23285 [Hymenobacter sp. HMF4947]|uniref:GNAT family N-acetyltransferase n=1 Tax=Hymenobacter ginkgonis TaxID=2682976 RepID=A0A7K1TLH1_9BACT|nr:hypothetical protein [Hymenobacter ginkgonis]MVN79267.1 hypothetical protein [Hymenobacter ginkgonis]